MRTTNRHFIIRLLGLYISILHIMIFWLIFSNRLASRISFNIFSYQSFGRLILLILSMSDGRQHLQLIIQLINNQSKTQNGQIHQRQKSIKKPIIFKISIYISLLICIYNNIIIFIQQYFQDIYYRKAKEDQFRARSAYKLLQIDDVFNIFHNVERAIDLCAAPGSWSQVIQKKLNDKHLFPSETVRIVAVDLQEMAPIDNVVQIQGDITKKSTVDSILKQFNYQKCDIIVSDGAPDITGFHNIDYYIQSQLIVAALNICLMTLKQDGIFIAKIFKGSDIKFLYSQFKLFFNQVYFIKPKSSRQSSVEYFIVCLQFQHKFNTEQFHLYTFQKEIDQAKLDKEQESYYKFLTCGDLSGFDE